MSRLNVSAMDTRDSLGRGRFFPFVPDQHLFHGKITPDYWYWQAIYYPPKQVISSCYDTRWHSSVTSRLFFFKHLMLNTGFRVLFGQRYFFPLCKTRTNVRSGLSNLSIEAIWTRAGSSAIHTRTATRYRFNCYALVCHWSTPRNQFTSSDCQ